MADGHHDHTKRNNKTKNQPKKEDENAITGDRELVGIIRDDDRQYNHSTAHDDGECWENISGSYTGQMRIPSGPAGTTNLLKLLIKPAIITMDGIVCCFSPHGPLFGWSLSKQLKS